MHKIRINGKIYHCPQNWEQVPAKDAMKISHLLVTPKEDPFYTRLAALQVLSGIPFQLLSAMTGDQLRDLCALIPWVDQPFLKPLKKYIRISGKRFYAPSESMKNTSAIEYHHCDFWLRRLEKSVNKEEVINTIISALYRPEGNGSSIEDKRERFDSKRIDFNMKYIRKISPEDKIMILTWFISCHIEINKKYKPMFQGEDDDSDSSKKEALGVLGLIFTVAETGIFGDFEKTCYTPVHTLFTYWTKKILDRKS